MFPRNLTAQLRGKNEVMLLLSMVTENTGAVKTYLTINYLLWVQHKYTHIDIHKHKSPCMVGI